MKVITVIGARPQFIKAAPFARAAQENNIQEILVHTGQHYDYQMSEVFFKELSIPAPKYNLSISGGTHGHMTGEMLKGVEDVLLQEKPDALLVYGDTNSTLAGALAASKLHIPVIHVEAGLRSWNRKMPEEVNRVLTDHISDKLFCSSQIGVENLKAEGITTGVYCEGDIMADANRLAVEVVTNDLEKYIFEAGVDLKDGSRFALATIHRAESTDTHESLSSIVTAINQCADIPIIVPLHPRTRIKMDEFSLSFEKHVTLIDPVGYLQMTALLSACRKVITDSGGLQKEAYWMGKPCVTLRSETEWLETVEEGRNRLWSPGDDIAHLFQQLEQEANQSAALAYGDGHSASKIAQVVLQ